MYIPNRCEDGGDRFGIRGDNMKTYLEQMFHKKYYVVTILSSYVT
jgi:hypothetical protein